MLRNIILNLMTARAIYFYSRADNAKHILRVCVFKALALQFVDSVMDIGHAVSSNDKDSMVNAAKASVWHVFNLFVSDFGHIYSLLRVNSSFLRVSCFMEHLCGI